MNKDFLNLQKTLNVKRVIITAAIVLSVLIIVLLFIFLKNSKNDNISPNFIYNKETNSTTFFDKNKITNLTISNEYGLEYFTPQNDYLFELRSKQNLNVFISSKSIFEDKSLLDVVNADKLAFTKTFESISNISEIKEITIGEKKGCTYSFHYLDKNINTTFYLQITWIEVDNTYYIFDIEFPLTNLENHKNTITDILNGFSKI